MNENLAGPIFELLKGDSDSKQLTKLVKKFNRQSQQNKNQFNHKTAARESRQKRFA